MSVQTIVDTLSNMNKLHVSLLEVSKKKTETLKTGDIAGFQDLLAQERKHVKAINQMEANRLSLIEDWSRNQGLDPSSTTVSVMLEVLEGSDKQNVEQATVQLAETLVELKNQEQLNKELIEQSLQFIQLSMDMISPTIKNINYSNKSIKQDQPASASRSLFDSKA
ncbi:flagellar protein FlgN [Aquibacillus koreensis]|uniref:Flagellar protein FlgN n=1 Tax=Aquibacillus koreensis TaxID=279446 RepID=A0A9X4AJB5_9BACI|nr:flagellar protein FlgN [Aquibacillus koreensis]MCT2537251.1 flagellar protein FlgN [Aquibacillus koreensis]MDC3421599.1 flagellar protein FlgN [Aquibacillus koreensis]